MAGGLGGMSPTIGVILPGKGPFLSICQKVSHMQFPSNITRWQPDSAHSWQEVHTGKHSLRPSPWERFWSLAVNSSGEISFRKGMLGLCPVVSKSELRNPTSTNYEFPVDAYLYMSVDVFLRVFFLTDLQELFLLQFFSPSQPFICFLIL